MNKQTIIRNINGGSGILAGRAMSGAVAVDVINLCENE